MITEIDGVKIPINTSGTAELQNFDTQRRTRSNRLITKLSPNEKWKASVNYDKDTLSLDFQNWFYAKWLEMSSTPKTIKIISPYTNEEVSITARCTSRVSPSVLHTARLKPVLYKNIGAVFEEV